MIYGTLKHLSRYYGMHPNIDKAIDFVLKTDLRRLPVGTVDIAGKDVYLLRQSYVGKPLEEAKAESHERYADLQIVIAGHELFGYADRKNPTGSVIEPYNEIKDVTKYVVQDEVLLDLKDGQFALVFPEDIHRPQVKVNDLIVEKAVVKIRL